MYSDDSDWAGWLTASVVTVAITAVAITLRLILMEAIRVYRAHAFRGTEKSRLLWYALAGFLVSIGVSTALAAFPQTIFFSPWTASIGFLAWVITIELVDLVGQGETTEELNLEDILAPWRFSPASGDGTLEGSLRS